MGAGLSFSSSTDTNNQENLNSLNQNIRNECKPKCSQIQNDQEIIVVDSKTGDIRFDQECNVNAQCAITTSINAAVKSIEAAHQTAKAGSPKLFYFGGQFSSASTDSNESTTNLVKQMIDSECGTDVNQTQKGNLIYVESSQTGDLSFNQKSNQQFKCALNTSASIQTHTQQQTTQSSTSGGSEFPFVLIIIAVIIIIIIFAFLSRKKKEPKPTNNRITPVQAALLV